MNLKGFVFLYFLIVLFPSLLIKLLVLDTSSSSFLQRSQETDEHDEEDSVFIACMFTHLDLLTNSQSQTLSLPLP